MDTQNTHFETLKSLVEKILSHPLKTSKDFAELHDKMQESNGETLGTTTLKRIWNYIGGDNALRESSLDILCQFVGYPDWSTFLADHCGDEDRESSNFVLLQTLRGTDLRTGDRIELRWNPNRRLLALHKGNGVFETLESENSKITVGTTFHCERFTIGLPLFIDILRPDTPPALYQAGKKGGITKIKVISDEERFSEPFDSTKRGE
ncbi:MAG: hypothetical protein IJQ89_08550 [Bacteroidales bacterium]|nr:hypothetical protein [Bacteroidales bacterium]